MEILGASGRGTCGVEHRQRARACACVICVGRRDSCHYTCVHVATYLPCDVAARHAAGKPTVLVPNVRVTATGTHGGVTRKHGGWRQGHSRAVAVWRHCEDACGGGVAQHHGPSARCVGPTCRCRPADSACLRPRCASDACALPAAPRAIKLTVRVAWRHAATCCGVQGSAWRSAP